MKENPAVQQFYSISPSALERSDLGTKGFAELTSLFTEIRAMIDEMISIVDTYPNVPSGLMENVYRYISDYVGWSNAILKYDMDSDARQNFEGRERLINSIRTWVTSIYYGMYADKTPNNFLSAYNSLKMFSLSTLQQDKHEIEKLKAELSLSNKNASDLISLLQAQATGTTIHDYAAIFKEQSFKHSRIKIWPLKQFKLGLAQVWLIVCVALTIAFGYFIKHENDYLPFDANNPNITIITLQLLTRLLVISFIIYIISFSIKQYNVQNHLSTVNQHRQNTLNSYKLFIESLDSEDGVTKNALMMEVAKSIYESGPSGYLSNKDNDSSPSIIEMTKYVGQSK